MLKLILVLLLVAAIPIGVYLVSQRQIFFPRAAIACRSDNNQTVEQYCLEGALVNVYEYNEDDTCKLFYEPTNEECTLSPSPSTQPAAVGTPTPTSIPAKTGDINGDGTVDYKDTLSVFYALGRTGCEHLADVNKDCKVNSRDIQLVIQNYSR